MDRDEVETDTASNRTDICHDALVLNHTALVLLGMFSDCLTAFTDH